MSEQPGKRDLGIIIDLVFVLGLLVVGVGLWLIDARLVVVLGGLVLMMLAVVVARR